jgi:tyrosine-specific transport protein
MGKVIGGIFLIVGISIGAGILALPVTTSTSGFFPSAFLLLFCWLLMTFNAFLILEANLWLPDRSNMISMARATLGRFGQGVAWVSYCLLLYALLAAYISAGSDVLDSGLSLVKLHLPEWVGALIFSILFGAIVYRGTKAIDYVNRGLIITKLGAFALILILVFNYIKMPNLTYHDTKYLTSTVMVMITSFGFATIVPSLRTYFNSDVAKLRIVILIGSLVPLLCYMVWILVILGTLPLEGENGLLTIASSGRTTSELIRALHFTIANGWVSTLASLFSTICIVTSFLGVALSLSDFLADGLNIKKQGRGNTLVYGLTFVPPLIIVLFYPSAFIKALNYAGTFCTILLALLPILMVWNGRYRKKIAHGYQLFGGKPALIVSLVFTIMVLILGILQEFHLVLL